MYHHLFALLREMHADQPIPLDVPDCYYTHLEEIVKGETDGSGTCILLEDLKSENYRMADKIRGADYRHCHAALTSLAHYHALTLSAVRKWKDPSTGQLSNMPPVAKFVLEEKSMYDAGIIKILQGFSVSIVNFAKEMGTPDVSISILYRMILFVVVKQPTFRTPDRHDRLQQLQALRSSSIHSL